MASREYIIDFGNAAEKRMIVDILRSLVGRWRVEVCPFRKRRTDRQNRYYWPCFVAPFGDFLRSNNVEVDGKVASDQDAHEILKFKFLPPRTVVDKTSGEIETIRGTTTTTLSTTEFNEYLDRVAQFLAEKCGFVVPDPSDYHEREAA